MIRADSRRAMLLTHGREGPRSSIAQRCAPARRAPCRAASSIRAIGPAAIARPRARRGPAAGRAARPRHRRPARHAARVDRRARARLRPAADRRRARRRRRRATPSARFQRGFTLSVDARAEAAARARLADRSGDSPPLLHAAGYAARGARSRRRPARLARAAARDRVARSQAVARGLVRPSGRRPSPRRPGRTRRPTRRRGSPRASTPPRGPGVMKMPRFML